MKYAGQAWLAVGMFLCSTHPASGASSASLRAKDSVFRVEVQQRSTRTPLIGEVFLRAGNRAVGFAEPHESAGTATVVDGRLITSYHLIESGTEIVVIDHQGGRHTASVVSGDPLSDLALLSLDEGSTSAVLGRGLRLASRDVGVGEAVMAIGYGAGEALALTEGIISARYGEGRGVGATLDLLWTDALITDGFSGGPLVNKSGECVGLLHAYGRPEGGLRDLGFVVPAAVVREMISPTSPWSAIGLTLRGTPDREGLIVEYIRSGSAADKAGIASGDHIQIVNGEALDSIGRLRQLLHHNRAKSLHIEGLREGEEREWSLEPVTMKPTGDPNLKRWRGLELEVSEEPGIYIVYVEAGTVGGRSGLAVDDRIVGLNGVEVVDSAALWLTLETLGDRPQLLLVRRGDQYLMLPTGP